MANTYYIDFVGGSDNNNGTSKATPWQRCPGMKGFGRSYSHVAGDKFIFKGGVTWPVSCFQLKVTWGGTSETVRDWYTVDNTWFNGTSWTRPLFDFQNTLVGSGWQFAAGVLFEGCNYVTVNGIELARHRAPLQGVNGISAWGSMTICLNSCNYVTVNDCIGRDWDQPTPMVNGGSGGGFLQKINNGTGHIVSNCEIHQQNSVTRNGTGVWNIGIVNNCHIHHLGGSAIMSAQIVSNCHIHHIENPTDPAAHGNVMLCNGGLKAFNNLIHDTEKAAMVFFVNAGYYGPSATDIIYNNVVYNVSQPCISIDTDGKNDPTAVTKIFNNTFVGPSGTGYCIRVGNRNNGPYGNIDYRNNHFISSNPVSVEVAVNHLISSNNLTQTVQQANDNGYSINNKFSPLNSNAATVNKGLNLSSEGFNTDILGVSRGTTWDLGAYEFTGIIQPPQLNYGTISFSSPSTVSVVESSSLVTLKCQRVGGSDGVVKVNYTTLNGTAIESVNFLPASGTLQWENLDNSEKTIFIHILNTHMSTLKTFNVSLNSPIGGAVLVNPSSVSVTLIGDPIITPPVDPPVNPPVEPPSTPIVEGLNWSAENGTLTYPFTVEEKNGIKYAFSSVSNQGLAVYTFEILTSSFYNIICSMIAPDDGHNSLFIGIDNPYFSDRMVWDIPVKTNWQPSVASWRGDGTWNKSEFVPKSWYLKSGPHTLYIGGREPNVLISSITMSMCSADLQKPSHVSISF